MAKHFCCPHCGGAINPAKMLGAKGGKITGKSKARSTEQARAAALARWQARRGSSRPKRGA